MKKNLIILFCAFFVLRGISSQTVVSSQSHDGKINDIFPLENESSGDAFFSAGNDGFIVKWTSDGMGEHYQVSDLQIRLVCSNPVFGDIAVYETDGISVHRVTLFDSATYAKKFSKQFANSVTSLSFSAKGKFLFVGTASVNGTFIFNARTGSVAKKAEDVQGVVCFSATGAGEKTAVMYAKSGTLYYYDLTAMKVKAQFSTVSSLNQTQIFGSGKFKNRFFAGVKNNTIYIIDATSGKTLAQYTSSSPLIFSSDADTNEKMGLYFISGEGKNFSLKQIDEQMLQKLVTGGFASSPQIVKNFSGLKSGDSFTCAAKNSGRIMMGTKSGALYSVTDIPESELYSLFPVTENMYEKILDLDAEGNSFYFLTDGAVFKTSYDTKEISRLSSNSVQTNILRFNGKTILWSKGTQNPVEIADDSGNTRTIFLPSYQVNSLRASDKKIICIQGNSEVKIIDAETGNSEDVYKGTSVQDALLYDDSTLIVAKSSSGKGDSALISVNLQTKETVPLKFSGNVAFSLCFDSKKENALIYGVCINSVNNSPRTQIFSYNPKNFMQQSLFSLQAEDPSSFASISQNLIFTNIGKNQLRAYNTSTRGSTIFKRSASMPSKTVCAGNRLAVLNRNGSISWYNPNSQNLLADWYFTVSGEWFEF
jgi:hypothetical protein